MSDFRVPASVEEAANLAEELHAKMFVTPTEEPSAEDITDEGQDEHQEVIDEDVEEEVSPEEEKKFRDRYLTLKGKYDAEVPRLAADIRELRELLNKQKVAEAPTNEPNTENIDDDISLVSEEYGEDFINAIRKVIKYEVTPIIKPVVDQTQSLKDTQNEVAAESFKSYLDTKVEKGDWRKVWSGEDKDFVNFLKQPDPSGLYTYGDLVELYNENWDGDRLARVFDTYFETKQTPATKRNTPNPQKDALIAPSRSNTQPAPTADGGRIWTMESFNQFQQDDRRGKYSAEESQKLWEDVQKAPSEGRMR